MLGDPRLVAGGSGTRKHCIYNNTFCCPSRTFLDDMTSPHEVRNNLFVASGGSPQDRVGFLWEQRVPWRYLAFHRRDRFRSRRDGHRSSLASWSAFASQQMQREDKILPP
ncbi:hypothetical protein StoSoilB5_11210 [Arthrobacter sp. StoSoilB5]|nr:hypothetical protein StoSoilB5_11210 [Arthrobacter sp. StoSoilB5]